MPIFETKILRHSVIRLLSQSSQDARVYFCHAVTIVMLPSWLSGTEFAFQSRRLVFNLWVRKIPWRRKWQPSLVFLPEKSHGELQSIGSQRVGHDSVTKQHFLSQAESGLLLLEDKKILIQRKKLRERKRGVKMAGKVPEAVWSQRPGRKGHIYMEAVRMSMSWGGRE